VNSVVGNAITKMEAAGAEMIDVSIPNLDNFLAETSLYTMQSKKDFNEFINGKDNVSVKNVNEIYEQKKYHEELELFEAIIEEGPEEPEKEVDYYKKRHAQKEFQLAIVDLLAKYNLDAIVFPDVKVLPPVQADIPNMGYTVLTFPTNTIIASQSGLPAIS